MATSGGELLLQTLIDDAIKGGKRNGRIRYQQTPAKTVEPDIVFMDEKIAVFYDGCYWHECPLHNPHARKGQALARDRRISAALMTQGWTVIRMWEHEDMPPIVARVVTAVRCARAELATIRKAHVASHEPNAWCEDCEQWPHKPWPIGKTGWCLRCYVHADEHEPDSGN